MTQTLVIAVIILALIGFRIWRQTRETRWSVVSMWIAPAIFIALTVFIVSIDLRATAFVLLAAIVGIAAGLAIGFYQGTHTTVRVACATGQEVSPVRQLPQPRTLPW